MVWMGRFRGFFGQPGLLSRLLSNRRALAQPSARCLPSAVTLTGVFTTVAASGAQRSFSGCKCDATEPQVEVGKQAAPKTTRLIIVRHGETSWNAEKRIQGQTNIKLNEVGHSQASQLSEVFRTLGLAESVDAIVSSDLTRASDTADAIAEVCPKARRVVDERLREFHFGQLQGQVSTDPDVKGVRDACALEWIRGNLEYTSHGGESAAEVISRGLAGFRAAAQLGSSVVIVTHGGLMKWTAVAIEMQGEGESSKDISDPRVINVMKSSLPNVCCSTVLYDHVLDSFHPQRWFENLISQQARDDSG